MRTQTANKITAHSAGWCTQFRFAGGVSWSGACEFKCWPAYLAYMRVWILIGSFSVLLLGCARNSRTIGAQGVDIAVNLGFEHERELEQIQSALISAGIPCNQRAMSCNEAPLVVKRWDFERARPIAVETVISIKAWNKSQGEESK